MIQPISLAGTIWRCIDEDMDEYRMTCTVISGEIHPDYNGENDIQITYQDGSTTYMKYRRFCMRFAQIKKKGPTKVSVLTARTPFFLC